MAFSSIHWLFWLPFLRVLISLPPCAIQQKQTKRLLRAGLAHSNLAGDVGEPEKPLELLYRAI